MNIATWSGKDLLNMSSKSSEEGPKLTGDEKYMQEEDKRNTYFSQTWRSKYEFDERLNKEKLESMIKQINRVSGDKTDKQWAERLNTARMWLPEARKRAENKGKWREASDSDKDDDEPWIETDAAKIIRKGLKYNYFLGILGAGVCDYRQL